MRVFFFGLTISAFVVCVCSFVHSPLLPPSVVGKVSDELVYISDWYVTISMLAGVAQAHVVNETGPVPSDGHNIWPMVIGAGATPPADSARAAPKPSESESKPSRLGRQSQRRARVRAGRGRGGMCGMETW